MRRTRTSVLPILVVVLALASGTASFPVRAADSPEAAVHAIYDVLGDAVGGRLDAASARDRLAPHVCAAQLDEMVGQAVDGLDYAAGLVAQYPDIDVEEVRRLMGSLQVALEDREVSTTSQEGDRATVEARVTLRSSMPEGDVRALARLIAEQSGEPTDGDDFEVLVSRTSQQFNVTQQLPSTPLDVIREDGEWRVCEGAGGDDPDVPRPPTPPPNAGGLGDVDAPVTATFRGQTYGFAVGTCEVRDDVVIVDAQSRDFRGSISVHWPAADEGIPLARRNGRVNLDVWGASTFSLSAEPWTVGTRLTASVSGTDARVTAQMADTSTPTWVGEEPPPLEIVEVVIDIRCDERGFGGSAPVPDYEPWVEQPRPGGRITVDLDGETYDITYLSTCSVGSWVSAEGLSDEAQASVSSGGDGIQLHLFIGDVRAEQDGTRFQPGPEALETEIDGLTATGTGTLLAPTGESVPVRVAVTCDPTGQEVYASAIVEMGDETHEVAFVTDVRSAPLTCAVGESGVSFMGQQMGSSGMFVTVSSSGTAGVSSIVLRDPAGDSYFVDDARFEILDATATWSGVLTSLAGEDAAATITVECHGPDPSAAG
ncbi:MAG: hypothetical protein KF809_03460 [Chloroflexi bacterium]|nr:hypothetical protein [Chloroflexota bacterium]